MAAPALARITTEGVWDLVSKSYQQLHQFPDGTTKKLTAKLRSELFQVELRDVIRVDKGQLRREHCYPDHPAPPPAAVPASSSSSSSSVPESSMTPLQHAIHKFELRLSRAPTSSKEWEEKAWKFTPQMSTRDYYRFQEIITKQFELQPDDGTGVEFSHWIHGLDHHRPKVILDIFGRNCRFLKNRPRDQYTSLQFKSEWDKKEWTWQAHVVSWLGFTQLSLPDNLAVVEHHCKNYGCVNPFHLIMIMNFKGC